MVPSDKQILMHNKYIEEKYFTFFSRRNMLLLKNVLLIDNFINHYQAADFINKLIRQFFKHAFIHFYRFLR